jgi:F-type H+-transporting ATPase subunit b
MIGEIFHEIVRDVSGSTGSLISYAAELIQFAILVAIIWVVGVGAGSRRGFLLNMLDERRAATRRRLADADAAEQALATAEQDAKVRVASAKTEAARIVSDAETGISATEAETKREIDAEAARIVERAEAALTNEWAQMRAELREELVELVSEATRSIMNETLSIAEQRERIEAAISSSIGGAGAAAVAPAKRAARGSA